MKLGQDHPDDWMIADVGYIFDRIEWNMDEGRYHKNGRVLWILICQADLFLIDADFRQSYLQTWSTHPSPVVMEWVLEQLEVLYGVMTRAKQPLTWDQMQDHVYLLMVSPLSAVLGLVGRWLCAPHCPNSDKDVNRHLAILPCLHRILLAELYLGGPTWGIRNDSWS